MIRLPSLTRSWLKGISKPLPPAKMFPLMYDHLSNMAMNVLTDQEHETGYADDDLEAWMMRSFHEYEAELRRDAQEKRAEQAK